MRRADNGDEPPFDCIEILLSGQATFGGGPTYQQDIQVTGWFGFNDDQRTSGSLAASATSGDGTVLVDATGSAAIGVGDLLTIGTERLDVTGRRAATTGTTLAADLAANTAVTAVTVAAPGIQPDEVITVGTERMLVIDVVGPALSVRRAWDGTVLAAHTSGDTVYAARLLTVERAVSGTTAAAHSSAAAVTRLRVPGLVESVTRAEALNTLLNERAGYARVSGSGETAQELRGTALAAQRALLRQRYRRQAFSEAV